MKMPQPQFAFFDGQVVSYGEARLGVMTHAFHYGTSVLGGIRAYWNNEEGQLFLFRPGDHLKRLRASAKLLGMELELTEEELLRHILELLRTEKLYEDCYIRAIVYYGDESLGVRLHDLTPSLAIIAFPYGHYGKTETGVHVTVSSWQRLDDTTIPYRARIAAAFVNVAFARTQAQRAGFDEPVMLDSSGRISENPLANLFLLRGETFVTPPANDPLLEGVTRRTAITLIREEMGMPVVERPIERSEIYLSDEALICGTGIQVSAVTCADHIPIGPGTPGRKTSRLRELYFAVARRSLPKYSDWSLPVYESRKYLERPAIDQRRTNREL